MPRLLMTTILVSALSTGVAFAQTPGPDQKTIEPASSAERVVPDGFTLQDPNADVGDLNGAELFDVMDAQIGTILEVIPSDAAESSDPLASGAAGASGASAAAEAVPDTAGAGASEEAATDTDEKTVGDGEPMDAEATGTSGVGPLAGAGTGDTEGTVAEAELEGTPPEPAEDAVEVSPATQEAGAGDVSYAVIALDNFPGVGQHRIAVPLSDLQIYRNDTALRVYISRTRDDLMALPVYDPNAGATLGAPKAD